MKFQIITFALIILLSFRHVNAGNNQQLQLSRLNKVHNLAPWFSYFRSSDIKDTSTRIIYDTNYRKKFIPNQQKEINFKITSDVFWFRFDVVNLTPDNYWYLTVDYPPLGNVTLFLRHNNGTVEKIPYTGVRTPYNNIIQDNTSWVFKLNLENSEPHTVFIRVNTSSFLLLPASIMDTEPYLQKNINRYTILFLILAILFAAFIINVTLFISTREKTYLLLILIITGILFISWYQFGFGIDLFPELNLYFKLRMRVLVSVLTGLLFNLFTIRFLELSEYRFIRNFYKILNLIIISYLVSILLPLLPNRWVNFINPSVTTIIYLLNFSVGIYAATKRTRTSIYYLPGLLLVILSAFIGILVLNDFINYHHLFSYVNMFSASLFCLSVTFGLREKIIKMQQDQKQSIYLKELNEQLLFEIDKREQTENELRQSHNELKAEQQNTKLLMSAIESTASTIVVTNVNAEIEYVNPSFSNTTGYSPEEVYGKKPSLLKTDHHPNEYYEKLWETILSGKSWKGEFLNKKKNGELFWESAVITPVIDELTNEINHFVAVKDDISELKNTLLELERSEKKQREINDSKSKLFSIIGHDLMNPFNALLGFSQILSENLANKDDVENVQYANIITSSVHKTMMLLQNLLIWAGQQTGNISFNPEKFNPKDVITEAIALIQPAAEEKGVRITYSVENNQQMIFDYQMTATIMRNLIWNAVNFTESGGLVSVSVSVVNNEAIFSVSDSGKGMDREELASLFISDHGATKTRNKKEAGYGLGLILCRDLAEAHHGNITAISSPGKGSTFTFKFPLLTT